MITAGLSRVPAAGLGESGHYKGAFSSSRVPWGPGRMCTPKGKTPFTARSSLGPTPCLPPRAARRCSRCGTGARRRAAAVTASGFTALLVPKRHARVVVELVISVSVFQRHADRLSEPDRVIDVEAIHAVRAQKFFASPVLNAVKTGVGSTDIQRLGTHPRRRSPQIRSRESMAGSPHHR